MPDPLFESRTARFDLPLLFAGQSQKETFVNESLARLDALLCLAIEGEQAAPPATPADGQAWLVASGASGDWTGQSGKIAARQAGNWLFAAPRDGLKLLNRATGQEQRFAGTWKVPSRPPAPSGGAIVDAEARTAIGAIIAALTTAGIVAAS
ncbi:MAG: DUF2793 domain-containing protein [Novosphingobium sp.]